MSWSGSLARPFSLSAHRRLALVEREKIYLPECREHIMEGTARENEGERGERGTALHEGGRDDDEGRGRAQRRRSVLRRPLTNCVTRRIGSGREREEEGRGCVEGEEGKAKRARKEGGIEDGSSTTARRRRERGDVRQGTPVGVEEG